MRLEKRIGHRYDGSTISLTKECYGCEFYREIGRKKLCGWGVAYKILSESKNPKKCVLLRTKPPRDWSRAYGEPRKAPLSTRSVEYLDEVIAGVRSD